MRTESTEVHEVRLRALRAMTPEQRLREALQAGDMVRELFRAGLRRRFPELSEEELHRLYLERLALCHNRNY
jgi:hypothetical protein